MSIAEPVAIIGMAGRFPASRDLDEFRRNLFAGRDCFTELTDADLAATGESASRSDRPDYVRRRPIMEAADEFDVSLFDMTPREAEVRDPQYRTFLEIVHATLNHAGYDPRAYDGRIGLYAGAGVNYYRFYNVGQRPEIQRAIGLLQVEIGNAPDYLSTYISYKLGLAGPSMTVLTACSTSLVSVHVACAAIRTGDCDMAIAGGVDIEFPFNCGYVPVPGGILAKDGVVRPFDQDATGTNFGNGAGAVLLKPLSAALADGDTIYARILGSAANNDADHRVGFTAPSVTGQSACIARALDVAGVDPRTISYVEAHGTATPVGDPIEIAGLTEAFRGAADQELPARYCAIGSVKSNVGHLGHAAGIAGLLKTVLALRASRIPATINVTELNHRVDWDNSPFRVVTEAEDWKSADGPRRAGVSSFGIGGTNAYVVLEEASAQPSPPAEVTRPQREALLWSAADERVADIMRERIAESIAADPGAFPDLAHSLRVGRTPLPARGAALATDAADAIAALNDPTRVLRSDGIQRGVVLAFPGQGAQRPRMLYDLYTEEPDFQAGCDAAFDVLDPLLDHDLRRLWREGDQDQLRETSVAQPLLYVTEYTLASCLLHWNVEPSVLIGHSVGELVAGAVAGVFDFESGLRAIAARAQLMQSMPRGAMLAVNGTVEDVSDLLTDELAIGAINGARQIVLSGSETAIEVAAQRLTQRKVANRKVPTSHAYHSPAMARAAEQFEAVLADLPLRAPEPTLFSAATGARMTDEQATSPAFWARQLIEPVRFGAAAEAVLAAGPVTVVEVGPGRTLGALLHGRRVVMASGARILAVESGGVPATQGLTNVLTQLWVDGQRVRYWHSRADQGYRRVATPGYPYQRARYWVDRKPNKPAAQPPTAATSAPAATLIPVESPAPARPGPVPVAEPVAASPGWSIASVEWVQDGIGRQPQAQLIAPRAAAVLVGSDDPVIGNVLRRAGYRTITAAKEFDPTSRDDWTALLDQAATAGAPVELIVHAALLRSPEGVGLTDLDRQLDASFYGMLAAAAPVARHQRAQRTPITFALLARHCVDVTGGEPVNPTAAMAPALLRSLAYEQPGLRVVCVDVGASTPPDALSRELAGLNAPLVALRGATRWLPRLRPIDTRAVGGRPRLRDRGVYLVTGGLGGIGMVVARALAETGMRPRIALLGRSGRPPTETEELDRLTEFTRATGGDVMVVRADVTDRDSLEGAVADVEAQFGPVHGVVHAAGLPGGGLAERRDRADAHRVLAVKTLGVLHIEDVFAARPELDFLALFSSQAALAGLYGSADYAAANAFLDAHARGSAGRERWTVSLQWPGWAEVGMAARSDFPLSALTGVAEATSHRSAPQNQDKPLPALVRRYAPGESWELDGHRFAGKLMLPGTAMLELAALAAWQSPAYADRQPLLLRDTVFIAPMFGDGQREVHVLLEEVAGTQRFRIRSRRVGGPADDQWTEHASGSISAAPDAAGHPHEPPPNTGRGPELVYGGLASWIEFGERWQIATDLHGDENERWCRLVLPEKFHDDLAEHPLHPAIVDVATNMLGNGEDGRYYAPFLYQKITVLAPLTADVTLHIRYNDTRRRPYTVDFDLYDTATGQLLAQFTGFTIREVPGDSVGDTTRDGVGRPDAAPPEPVTSKPRIVDPDRPGLLLPAEGAAAFLDVLSGAYPPVVFIDAPGPWLRPAGIPWTVGAAAAAVPVVAKPSIPQAPEPPTTPATLEPGRPTSEPKPGPERNGVDPLVNSLRALWTEALGLAEVGLDDDFFEVGGNSLAAVALVARIRAEHDIELSAGAMFELSTIRKLADEVRPTIAAKAE